VTVTPQLPRLAATEIARVGSHPSMVQICLPVSSPGLPYGHEFYHPIWEACTANQLRVGFHVMGGNGLAGSANAAGWPATFMEQWCQYSNIFEVQLSSLVVNGVFEKFPELRIVLIEAGFAWVPAVLWRMDQSWRALRSETPWLKRRPSDYVRDHVRWTTEPFEEPNDPSHILKLIDMMGSDRLLMFGSNYPYKQLETPEATLPKVLGPTLVRRILWENASDFYSLPVSSSVVEPRLEK
jgi:uncharacterized protein